MNEFTKFAFAVARIHAYEVTGNPQFLEKPMQSDDQGAELFDAADEASYANDLMQERYRLSAEALQRCAKAGAKEEDIKTLCRETGVNIKDVLVGGSNAAHR